MFKAFQLDFTTFNISTLQGYMSMGKSMYKEQEAAVHKSLAVYTAPDGYLDAAKIEEDWFPQKAFSFDVFLSHSHKDEELMIALAGYLYKELGLECFIDSQLWGYSEALQPKIDKACCRHDDERNTWNYDDRNVSTSYVHNMLVVALTKMMDATECFFFAKTVSSTIKDQALQTLSPWIYTELSVSKMLRPQPKREERIKLYESGGQVKYFSLEAQMKFTPPMDHLIKLSWYDIVDWVGIVKRNHQYGNNVHPLDVLYQLKDIYK